MLKSKIYSKLDPDYKKQFKERLKDLHVVSPTSTPNGCGGVGSSSISSNGVKSPKKSSYHHHHHHHHNNLSPTTAINGGNLIRTVSKSCDNHINNNNNNDSPAAGSPNGRGCHQNGHNHDDEDDGPGAPMSNSLNTLLNGCDDEAADAAIAASTSTDENLDRSIEFINENNSNPNGETNGHHIYDNNGILTTDETGNFFIFRD